MKKKLQVANIGMKFGMCHVEGALNCKDAEIAIICDSNEENLRFAGERYNIPEEKRTTDYMDIVNNPDIESVACRTLFAKYKSGFAPQAFVRLKTI